MSNWKNSDFGTIQITDHLAIKEKCNVNGKNPTQFGVQQMTSSPCEKFTPKSKHINIMKLLLFALIESDTILHQPHKM